VRVDMRRRESKRAKVKKCARYFVASTCVHVRALIIILESIDYATNFIQQLYDILWKLACSFFFRNVVGCHSSS
jgi:hypothetical protein